MGKSKSNAKTVAKNKKTSKPNIHGNGKQTSKPKPVKAVPSSKSSFGLLSFLTTLTSFVFGVLTPPVVHYLQVRNEVNFFPEPVRNSDRVLDEDDPIMSFRPYSCSLSDNAEYDSVLSKEPVKGMHTICFQTTDQTLHFFRNSVKRETPTSVADLKLIKGWKQQFLQTLESTLNLGQRPNQAQPWALFTTQGFRVADQESLVNNHALSDALHQLLSRGMTFVLMEGGQWIWPGIEIGFRREIRLENGRNATLETKSLHPMVVSVHGFLSDDECTLIQDTAEPHMQYSEVTLMDKDKGRPASDFRTSQTYFLGPKDYDKGGTLEQIDKRTASLVRIPQLHQEYVQVLRYGHGERYKAHVDYFDPSLYQQDKQTLRMTESGLKNRLATVFWYLSDVPSGGETVFPRFNRGAPPRDTGDCSIGLKVKPERGKVIIFYSMTPDGRLDPYSQHGACPVQEGIKWAANKWVWNKPAGYYR